MGVGAVNVVSLCYSNQKSIAGGDEIMLRNLMVREYFSAIAASFNTTFEATCALMLPPEIALIVSSRILLAGGRIISGINS
jgi:hypothetical protein